MKLFAFTLDLESDYAGYVDNNDIFKDLNSIDTLLSTLNALDVKITAFTVGSLFDQFPEVIDIFKKYNCEFECHSYSHDFNKPDSETEIEKAKKAYHNYFNTFPRGYRSPRGMISSKGIRHLDKHGFQYDSSIFPSYFPNPFRYLFNAKNIHYHEGTKIMEIPFTAITPLRLTLSVSYIKLFGVELYIKLSRLFSMPSVICFDSHLHDFIHSDVSYSKLSLFWRMIYGRNKFKGTEYCVRFLKHMKEMGYKFCYMSEIYEKHHNARQ